MARCPFATQKILPENATAKRIDPTQAILHTAVDAPGPTSLYGLFSRGDFTLESHFYVKWDGGIEQYMDTERQADANRDANVRAISIETEDEGNPHQNPWTPAQVKSIVRLLDWICDTHPKVLRRRCPAWDQPGIGYHSMWGAPSHWTPSAGKTCPGIARIPQVGGIIKAVQAAALPVKPAADPTPPPAPTQETSPNMQLIFVSTTSKYYAIVPWAPYVVAVPSAVGYAIDSRNPSLQATSLTLDEWNLLTAALAAKA